MAEPLSAVLRARTAGAHEQAERSPFLTALAEGAVTVHEWAGLLARLLPVHEALERAAAAWAADPRLRGLVQPELDRSARLRADLAHLGTPVDGQPSAASAAWVARIEDVADASAPAFVAHHYTRCLADLSGGQVVRAALERALGLAEGRGTSSLHFPGLRPTALAQQYRERLDGLPFDADQREELVEEVLLAYRLNTALADEVGAARTVRP